MTHNEIVYAGLALVVILWLLLGSYILLQLKKKRNKHLKLIKSIQKGDVVSTYSALTGVVDSIDTDNGTVTLNCNGVFLLINIQDIISIQNHTKKQKN